MTYVENNQQTEIDELYSLVQNNTVLIQNLLTLPKEDIINAPYKLSFSDVGKLLLESLLHARKQIENNYTLFLELLQQNSGIVSNAYAFDWLCSQIAGAISSSGLGPTGNYVARFVILAQDGTTLYSTSTRDSNGNIYRLTNNPLNYGDVLTRPSSSIQLTKLDLIPTYPGGSGKTVALYGVTNKPALFGYVSDAVSSPSFTPIVNHLLRKEVIESVTQSVGYASRTSDSTGKFNAYVSSEFNLVLGKEVDNTENNIFVRLSLTLA
jgi:hypothetical protein